MIDPDPAIEIVRAARHRISAECDHDPEKLLRHYCELQAQFGARLVRGPEELESPPERPDAGAESSIHRAERVAERPELDD